MIFSNGFSKAGERECEKIGDYFSNLYAHTLAQVNCGYVFGDYVVEITENGRLVNKFIAYPGFDGLIDPLRVKGLNLQLYLHRYRLEQKVLWFDADDCETDGWGEYIDFSIVHI